MESRRNSALLRKSKWGQNLGAGIVIFLRQIKPRLHLLFRLHN